MQDETQNIPTFNDVPCLLANIDEKLGIIVEWIQSGGSQQDPHAILTIDELWHSLATPSLPYILPHPRTRFPTSSVETSSSFSRMNLWNG